MLRMTVTTFIVMTNVGNIRNPIAFDIVFLILIMSNISLTLKFKIFESKIVMFSSLILDSMLIVLGTITVIEE